MVMTVVAFVYLKIPDKSNFRKKEFILPHSSRLQPEQGREAKAAGNIPAPGREGTLANQSLGPG